MSEKALVVTPDALTKGKRKPDVVDVPARAVLSIDGAGAPSDPPVRCVRRGALRRGVHAPLHPEGRGSVGVQGGASGG